MGRQIKDLRYPQYYPMGVVRGVATQKLGFSLTKVGQNGGGFTPI